MAIRFAASMDLLSLAEITTAQSGQTVDGTVSVPGGKNSIGALKNASTATNEGAICSPGVTSNPTFLAGHFRFADLTTPGATYKDWLLCACSGGFNYTVRTAWLQFEHTNAGVKNIHVIIDNSTNAGTVAGTFDASSVITSTTDWYHFEMKVFASATVGTIDVRLNGTTIIALTNVNTIRTSNGQFNVAGTLSAHTRVFWVDNILQADTDWSGTDASVMTRQFKSGTPTDNPAGWTKTGGAIDVCWSTTPTDGGAGATRASTSTTSLAQTALTSSFSTSDVNFGSTVIGANDTMLAAYVIMNYRVGTATTPQIATRFRFPTANDGTQAGFATANQDTHRRSSYYTPTLAQLNASEAGAITGTGAGTRTVADVWVMAVYRPTLASYLALPHPALRNYLRM